VLVDRPDALLVFGGISPALVSTPNDALTLSLVVGFEPDEVAKLGETVDGTPVTKVSMTRRFINELLFKQANVVGVDLADAPDGVPAVTQLLVADESMEASARALSERFFADAEVSEADELIDGVDVVVVLGEDFLVKRAELLEIERKQAEQAAEEDRADFDLSGSSGDTDGTNPTGDSSDSVVPDTTGQSVDSTVPDTSSDTVVGDG